jgi:hypothetical protein
MTPTRTNSYGKRSFAAKKLEVRNAAVFEEIRRRLKSGSPA